MKRTVVITLCAVLLIGTAMALSEGAAPVTDEAGISYDDMSDESLIDLRESLYLQINEIDAILAQRSAEHTPEIDAGMRIMDIFPCEGIAMIIRDSCQKFSIEQTVTQEDLDKVTTLYVRELPGSDISLEGIGHLKNLEKIYFYETDVRRIPEEIVACKNLKSFGFVCTGLEEIPDFIGELKSLEEITVCFGRSHSKGQITSIPDSICTLDKLKELNIKENRITALPENIGALKSLRHLEIQENNISSLPESIYELELDFLDMSGNPIR